MKNDFYRLAIAMGCAKSTQNGDKDEKKGKNAQTDDQLQLPPPQPVEVDSRLPMTARQKYSLVASWRAISRALEPTGIAMFLKLFEQNQELLNLFEKFRELKTAEQQASSMELQEHATNVMTTVDDAIKELDSLDGFFQYLHQIGASHRKIPGFKPEYFWKIEQPFLSAVSQTLGDRYTDNIETIYQITIKLIIETLIQGYEQSGPS